MNIPRFSCGEGRPVRGAHGALALAVGELAKRAGFTLRRISLSRTQGSPSRYVHLYDRQGRIWLIRVSNHDWGGKLASHVPNLDVVSRDGHCPPDTRAAIAGYFRRAIGGEVCWRDPDEFARSRDRKRR